MSGQSSDVGSVGGHRHPGECALRRSGGAESGSTLGACTDTAGLPLRVVTDGTAVVAEPVRSPRSQGHEHDDDRDQQHHGDDRQHDGQPVRRRRRRCWSHRSGEAPGTLTGQPAGSRGIQAARRGAGRCRADAARAAPVGPQVVVALPERIRRRMLPHRRIGTGRRPRSRAAPGHPRARRGAGGRRGGTRWGVRRTAARRGRALRRFMCRVHVRRGTAGPGSTGLGRPRP